MSWTLVNDLNLDLDGVDVGCQPSNRWESDFTYNFTPMLTKAFEIAELDNPDGEHLRNLSGLNNKEAAPLILKIWTTFLQNRDVLEDLEPDNGWGTYEQLCEVLQKMHVRNTRCFNEHFVWRSF